MIKFQTKSLITLFVLYITQVILVEIRILIPHLIFQDKEFVYIYRYGNTDYDGLFPLLGLMVFRADGTRVQIYKDNVLVETISIDLFEDYEYYNDHVQLKK